MSGFSEAVAAVQSALKLSDELRRTSQELKDVAVELREHDRRITRLGGAVGDRRAAVAPALGMRMARGEVCNQAVAVRFISRSHSS
jgi:hypothetical protein